MIDQCTGPGFQTHTRHRLLASMALAELARKERLSQGDKPTQQWWARCALLTAGALSHLDRELRLEDRHACLEALMDLDALADRARFQELNPRLAQYISSIPGFTFHRGFRPTENQRDHHGLFLLALLPILSEAADALLALEPHLPHVGEAIAREPASVVAKACLAYEVRRQIEASSAPAGLGEAAKSL